MLNCYDKYYQKTLTIVRIRYKIVSKCIVL